MKSFLPILSLFVLATSCTTAYKIGQTPDDVYFSPERPREEYVRTGRDDDRRYRNNDQYSDNDYYSYDDSYLRMKVRSRQRWSYLENDYYAYNPFAYRYYNNYYYNSPWNSYSYWNQYYNPYAPQVIVANPKSPTYNRPRTMNLRVFENQPATSNNPKVSNSRTRNTYIDVNSNRNNTQRRDFGNDLRNTFGNNNSTNSSINSSRSSSSSSSSSSGSSGGSSGGGSAPVRRF